MINLTIACIYGPWYFTTLAILLAAYNISRYLEKDHRVYFISTSEYKPYSQKFERQFWVKSAIYAFFFVATFVMTMLSAIEFYKEFVGQNHSHASFRSYHF